MLMVENREVYAHRHIMAIHLGRPLRRDEVVHHKNHDRTDNRLENLELMSHSDHARMHCTERGWMAKMGADARWGKKHSVI